jgi:hypothetical protein
VPTVVRVNVVSPSGCRRPRETERRNEDMSMMGLSLAALFVSLAELLEDSTLPCFPPSLPSSPALILVN